MLNLGLTSKFYLESSVEKWERARAVGFENIEIAFKGDRIVNKMIQEAEDKRSQALKAGLKTSSSHLPSGADFDISSANIAQRRFALNTQKTVIDLLSDWEIPIAILHASWEPIDDEERIKRFELAKEGIQILGQYAKEKSVTLAVEVLGRSCIGNCADELLDLTDNGTEAKINLDFNHLLLETHQDFIKKTGNLIVTTHLSDYDFIDEKHWMPGYGKIEWKSVMKSLIDSGYSGQLMFETYEQRAIPGIPKTSIETVMENWKRLDVWSDI